MAVTSPATSWSSFTAIGTPSSGVRSPASSRRWASAACARAPSAQTVRKAFSFSSTCSSLRSTASSRSGADTSPSRSAAACASAPAHSSSSTSMRGTVGDGRSGKLGLAEEDLGLLQARARHGLQLGGRLGELGPNDVGAAQRDHHAEVAVLHRVRRVQAEAGGEDAVVRGRGAATLDVPEHDRTRLLAGARRDLLGEPLADAAETDMAERVLLAGQQLLLAALGQRALGDHDDRRVLTLEPPLDPVDDLVDVEVPLRHQDHVRAAGEAGVQRDPAGVAAHDLDDQGAVVRLGGGAQPVDGLGRDVHRGVEAEGVVGGAEVVVDGLRHTDHADAVVGQPLRDAEGVLAADRDQGVDLELGEDLPDPLDAAVDLVRVGPRRAEDRAAAGQDVLDLVEPDRLDEALDRALPAVAETDGVPPVGLDALADHGANDRVESWAVTATCEQSNAHVLDPPTDRLSRCPVRVYSPVGCHLLDRCSKAARLN